MDTNHIPTLSPPRQRKRYEMHGMRYFPEYHSWEQMKRRCLNPRAQWYHRYGGRGIAVCPQWLTSFAAFYKDMGPKPGPHYTLERKDRDGNYEPSNCIWATKKQQANNTVRNHWITFQGETRTMTQWAEHLGMPWVTLARRIYNGWSVERALTKDTKPRQITFRGETHSLTEWAQLLGMKRDTLKCRFLNGWPVEEALTSQKKVNQYG